MRKTIYIIAFLLLRLYGYGFNDDNEDKKNDHKPKENAEEKVDLAQSHTSFLEKIDEQYGSTKAFVYSFSEQSLDHEFDYHTIAEIYQQQNPGDNKALKEATATFLEIEESGAWIDVLDEEISEFPVGIDHKADNFEYSIGFTRARVTAQYTELTVFVRIITPWMTRTGERVQLFAGAENVKLSHGGGIIGQPKAVLLGDFHLPLGDMLVTFRGGFDYRTGNTEDLTYVTFDCNGFKEMVALIEVEVSRNVLIPTDLNGNPAPATRAKNTVDSKGRQITIQIPNRVRATANIKANNLNDILVSLDFDQSFVPTSWYKIASRNNRTTAVFTLQQAVFDFSDLKNDPEVNNAFPQYYHDQGLLLPNANAWRGIYVKNVEVRLPEEFQMKKNSSVRC